MSITKYKKLLLDSNERRLRVSLCKHIVNYVPLVMPFHLYDTLDLSTESSDVSFTASLFNYHYHPFRFIKEYKRVRELSHLLIIYVTDYANRDEVIKELMFTYSIDKDRAKSRINTVWKSLEYRKKNIQS